MCVTLNNTEDITIKSAPYAMKTDVKPLITILVAAI